MAEEEYQEYLEPEDSEEEYDERGKLRVLADCAMHHPRWSLGASAGLTSFVVDLFAHFNPVAVVVGIGAVVVISWQAEGIIEEIMYHLAPGSNQEQVGAIAFHIANRALGDYPVYRDQRPIAKLRRLIGRGDYSVVEEDEEGNEAPTLPKRAVKSLPPVQSRSADPVTLAIQLFAEDKINADQFLALLERIDGTPTVSPIRETGETVKPPVEYGETGESPVKVNEVSRPLSPIVSPEDGALIVRTAFSIQAQKGSVTREDIKTALGWNNKRHGEIKAICDKYGIAMPGKEK